MAGYSHVKLLDVEVPEFAKERGIDARLGRSHMNSRDLGVSLWRFPAGYKSEGSHRHREQEEAYLVLSGSGRMLLDGDVIDLEPWDLIRVAPETARGFAAGPDGLELVAVGGPRPEEGDGERADVTWPDEV